MKTSQSGNLSRKTTYSPVIDLPPLSPEELEALRANIALHGVLIPIVVDCDGPIRGVIDGNHRKSIADELGYDCPEIVQSGLTSEEKRAMSRALNLARRQLAGQQKRDVIADQLRESPSRSNRWIARILGVHHATVASVRIELETTGQIIQCSRLLGVDGRAQPAKRSWQPSSRSPDEEQARATATRLILGDCRDVLPTLPSESVDLILTDPIYPEVQREYGRICEADWHELMHEVVRESRRILKPSGSLVVILQPNYEHIGQMRLWLWEFVAWAGREWNLVQDVFSWTTDAMPLAGTNRHQGLLRQSVKMCVWLGEPDCFRNQQAVLRTPSSRTSERHASDLAVRPGKAGKRYRGGSVARTAAERGGTTPFNMLPISNGGYRRGDHPATTAYPLADWWCRYLLPSGGVLLDPFCGSGTILTAGLNAGASEVIGIEREHKYLSQISSSQTAQF